MKILKFKKGDPVPEWMYKSKSKYFETFFCADVSAVKYSTSVEIYPHDERTETFFHTIDKRPEWLRRIQNFIGWKYGWEGRKINFHSQPLNYVDVARRINRNDL